MDLHTNLTKRACQLTVGAWTLGLLLGGAAGAQTADAGPAAVPPAPAPAAAVADGGTAPATAATAGGPATAALRDANERLRALLGKVPAGQKPDARTARAITEELRSLFDIEDLTKRALAAHWAKMTPAQRRALSDTLRDVVEQNYVSQLRSNLRYELRYEGEEAQGEDRKVRTRILAQRRGRPFELKVDYVLHPQANGSWRAYDVVTDGVSLLSNYRGQFNRIIARDGVDGLIRRMKARLQRGAGQTLTGDAPAPR